MLSHFNFSISGIIENKQSEPIDRNFVLCEAGDSMKGNPWSLGKTDSIKSDKIGLPTKTKCIILGTGQGDKSRR